MSMMTIALVSCVKSKRESPTPACDLYTSPLFIKMRAYAEYHADNWFILSAKHGLLSPLDVVEPYEETLNTFDARNRKEWAGRVYSQMNGRRLLNTGTTFLWLSGRKYWEHLKELLKDFVHLDPLNGMPIGRRLQWLTQQTRNL